MGLNLEAAPVAGGGMGLGRFQRPVGKASNVGCEINKHLFNNGPGCSVAGTAIATSSGYRSIETIEVGDRVTTVSGSAQLGPFSAG
jgi:hypothetical protein